MATKAYVKTRTLIDGINVLSLFGQETIICVDVGVLQIIRKLLDRAFWSSTYYVSKGEQFYETPTPEQMDIIEQKLSDFYAESDNAMSLCSDLTTVLQDIGLRITANGYCCDDSSGGVFLSTDTELEPIEGIQASEPPLGWYPTLEPQLSEAYYDRKCRAANFILDGLKSILVEFDSKDVAGIANVLGVGLAISTLAAILTVAVAGPFVILVGVLGALSAAVALFLGGSLDFGAMSGWIDSKRQEFICAMFEATSATQAKDDVIAIFATEGANASEQALLDLLFKKSGAMNNLFFVRPDMPALPEVATTSCASCVVTCPAQILVYGTQTGLVSNVYSFESVYIPSPPNNGSFVSLHFGADTMGGQCGPSKDVEIVSIDSTSNEPAQIAYRRSDTHFLGGAGSHNPNWTELQADWSVKIGVKDVGARTLTLWKRGVTLFNVDIEVT